MHTEEWPGDDPKWTTARHQTETGEELYPGRLSSNGGEGYFWSQLEVRYEKNAVFGKTDLPNSPLSNVERDVMSYEEQSDYGTTVIFVILHLQICR